MSEIKYPDTDTETETKEETPAEAKQRIDNHLKEQARKISDKLEEKREVATRPVFRISDAQAKFDQYIQKVDEMFAQAKAMIVNSDVTNIQATELGTSAMTLYKKINTTKSQIPYYDEASVYVAAVDSLAAMLTDKLYSTSKKKDPKTGEIKTKETIVSITKQKIAEYAVVLEGLRRKQEALELKARDNLQKTLDDQAEETGTIAPKVGGPLISSKKDTTVRTPTGSAYPTHFWDYKLVNPGHPNALVAKILSLIDANMGELYELAKRLDAIMPFIVIGFEDGRIRKGVLDGLRHLEGIEIFEKTDIRFKTSKGG